MIFILIAIGIVVIIRYISSYKYKNFINNNDFLIREGKILILIYIKSVKKN